MTNPQNISITDFTYPLPEDRIAKYPLSERDASKLLIYKDGEITENKYKSIAQHIPANSLLIFNNTRVVEARLLFQKPTGGFIEIFCLEPHEQYPDITSAMLQKEKVWWHCLVGGMSKWKSGQLLQKKILQGDKEIVLTARFIEKKKESFIISLSWSPVALSFAEILQHAGVIPLPPYIKRLAEESDNERYQTIYSQYNGSVAAPTAGLHFTPAIFNALLEKKIKTDFVTLHVGAGTFKPVKSNTMQEHEMHSEYIIVSRESIELLIHNLENNILAVGTTSLRTIESLYWLGVRTPGDKHSQSKSGIDDVIELHQWDAYDLAEIKTPVKDALQALLNWMENKKLVTLIAKTQLLIAPGYQFKIVKGLITNFHQPQSTLLLLVSSFIDDNLSNEKSGWRNIYNHALNNDYRFLSYGDGCLLWRPSK
jgi:S-adenosylmethionine:tRNA ribosyltransferase-isomerase